MYPPSALFTFLTTVTLQAKLRKWRFSNVLVVNFNYKYKTASVINPTQYHECHFLYFFLLEARLEHLKDPRGPPTTQNIWQRRRRTPKKNFWPFEYAKQSISIISKLVTWSIFSIKSISRELLSPMREVAAHQNQLVHSSAYDAVTSPWE